jgi:hypothetical protein
MYNRRITEIQPNNNRTTTEPLAGAWLALRLPLLARRLALNGQCHAPADSYRPYVAAGSAPPHETLETAIPNLQPLAVL